MPYLNVKCMSIYVYMYVIIMCIYVKFVIGQLGRYQSRPFLRGSSWAVVRSKEKGNNGWAGGVWVACGWSCPGPIVSNTFQIPPKMTRVIPGEFGTAQDDCKSLNCLLFYMSDSSLSKLVFYVDLNRQ